MKHFGVCQRCKEWGALWPVTRLAKRFWLFGPLVPHVVYRCDECEGSHEAPEGAESMSDKWAEYREEFCGCKDASRNNSCKGLANCYLRPNHPERKNPPVPEPDLPGSIIRVMRGPGGSLYLSGVEDLREGDVFKREERK